MYYKATENTLCGAGILLNPFDPGANQSTSAQDADETSEEEREWTKQKT